MLFPDSPPGRDRLILLPLEGQLGLRRTWSATVRHGCSSGKLKGTAWVSGYAACPRQPGGVAANHFGLWSRIRRFESCPGYGIEDLLLSLSRRRSSIPAETAGRQRAG